MESQKKSALGFIWELVIIPFIQKHGSEVIDALIYKLQGHKASAAKCPPGYILNSSGNCVPDIG